VSGTTTGCSTLLGQQQKELQSQCPGDNSRAHYLPSTTTGCSTLFGTRTGCMSALGITAWRITFLGQ
jgi:hypothetical protein